MLMKNGQRPPKQPERRKNLSVAVTAAIIVVALAIAAVIVGYGVAKSRLMQLYGRE